MKKIVVGDCVKTTWNNHSTIHGVVEHVFDDYCIIKIPAYYGTNENIVFSRKLTDVTKVEHTINITEDEEN